MNAPSRLLPGRPFPPYSYVTGKFPHPMRDPRGHSYGAHPVAAAVPSRPTPHSELRTPNFQWQHCEPYLWGIDLFNHGYYWEAHEAWESAWHAAGRRGPTADFLKALIKLAAAGVKAREGRPEGIRRHALRAKELLNSVTLRIPHSELRTFMGLSLPDLIASADRLIADPAAIVDTTDDPVVILMPFGLQIAGPNDYGPMTTDP